MKVLSKKQIIYIKNERRIKKTILTKKLHKKIIKMAFSVAACLSFFDIIVRLTQKTSTHIIIFGIQIYLAGKNVSVSRGRSPKAFRRAALNSDFSVPHRKNDSLEHIFKKMGSTEIVMSSVRLSVRL
jgi:hypothetical protein